jgi:hypothetical protein
MGFKTMKKTLVGILVCGMMLVTILPLSALGIASRADTGPMSNGLLDRTTVRGFALYLGMDSTGRTTHLFALRLHYSTISLSGVRSSGVILMRPIDISTKIFGYRGHVYVSGSFRGPINV